MNLQIQCIHFHADKKLLQLIDHKLAKFTKFANWIIDLEVYLKLEASHSKFKDKIIEIKLNVKGYSLFVKSMSKTFEDALDNAVDDIYRQFIKFKEKVQA